MTRLLGFFLLALIVIPIAAQCQQKQTIKKMNVELTVAALEHFIKTEKFVDDTTSMTPRLSHPEIKEQLNRLLNMSAADFIRVTKEDRSDKNYQEAIRIGLERFAPYDGQLDSEDEDRIGFYYEQLMDIVGLESSNGYINKWRYGFDPTVKPH